MSRHAPTKVLTASVLVVAILYALESQSTEPARAQGPAAELVLDDEVRSAPDERAPQDEGRGEAVLRKLAPGVTVSVGIQNHRPSDAPWRTLDASIKPNGSGELRVTERRGKNVARKVHLDEAQRIALLKSALEALDNFEPESEYFEDGTSSTFTVSAGSGSVTVATTRTRPCPSLESVACFLNGILPAEERLSIGTHVPAPHESQLHGDRLLVRRVGRRLIETPLKTWDVSLRIVSPDQKVLIASIDRDGKATIKDDAPDGSGPRSRRNDAQGQRSLLSDLALKCFERYALVPPRELPTEAVGKTSRCNITLNVYGKAYGKIEKVSSITISDGDFEGNRAHFENVHAFLNAMTKVLEAE